MALILNLCSTESDKKGRLEIDGNCLLIEFIPATDSPEDKHAAAVRRNRFNFAISFFLSSFLEEELLYERNPDLNQKEREGFCILLKFKQDVDLELINLFLGGQLIPHDVLYQLLPKESLDKYNTEYYPAKETRYQRNEMLDSILRQQKVSMYDALITESNRIQAEAKLIQSELEEHVKDYAASEEEIEKCLMDKIEALDQFGSVHGKIKVEFDSVPRLPIREDIYEPNVDKAMAELNRIDHLVVECENKRIHQEISLTLLERNLQKDEAVLLYASLSHQQHIRIKMKVEDHPDQDLYDDLLLSSKEEAAAIAKMRRDYAQTIYMQALERDRIFRMKFFARNENKQSKLPDSENNKTPDKNKYQSGWSSYLYGTVSSYSNYAASLAKYYSGSLSLLAKQKLSVGSESMELKEKELESDESQKSPLLQR